ncbi:MAG: hypothetical protein GYB66_12005 [Chloroflexi bacterium]|nr:hypothetical protein [Chloroflexota bacterium]
MKLAQRAWQRLGLFCAVTTAVATLSMGAAAPLPSNAQSSTGQLAPFQAVSGELAPSPGLADEWQFPGAPGQMISLVAQTTSGDLDPVLELYGPSGDLLAANDNASFGTTDARIEGVWLNDTGLYRVRVYREGLQRGPTAGTYILTLLRGYANWPAASAQDQNLTPDPRSGWAAQELGSLPANGFFVTSGFQGPGHEDYELSWEFNNDTFKWRFWHNQMGTWALSLTDAEGNRIARQQGRAEALRGLAAAPDARLSLHYNLGTLTAILNQQPIVSVQIPTEIAATIDAQEDLMATVSLQIAGNQGAPPGVDIDGSDAPPGNNPPFSLSPLYITTPFYAESPLDSGAVGPTPPSGRLYGETSEETIGELRTLGYISRPGTGIQGEISEGFILNDVAGYWSLTLIQRPFQDIVLGFTASVLQGPPETACGVLFRQLSASDFATMLFTPQQGIYFYQYQGGVPTETQIARFSPSLLPGVGSTNRFVIVAMGDTAHLFINGRLEASMPVATAAGSIASHLVIREPGRAYCQFQDIWLWSAD